MRLNEKVALITGGAAGNMEDPVSHLAAFNSLVIPARIQCAAHGLGLSGFLIPFIVTKT